MATQADTKSTVKQDQKEKIEGLKAGAILEDHGVRKGEAPGVPPSPPKKGETRLFEVSPGNKVWLTEAEATSRGFFWRPDPDKKKS